MRSKVTVRPPTLTCLTITGCLPSASWAGSACCPPAGALVVAAPAGAEVACAAPPPDESSSDPHATSPSMETTAKNETAVRSPRRCPMDALHPQTSQPAEESMLLYACRGEIGGDADPSAGMPRAWSVTRPRGGGGGETRTPPYGPSSFASL